MTIEHGFIGENPYISTVKGNKFYINAPVFDVEEIAHATAMICRFGGHVSKFYSVAEHQVLVADICRYLGLADPLEGLLHDGHEGYLVDLPKPWKAWIKDYNTIEHTLESALRKQFNLPPTITDGCKRADLIALAIESKQLMKNHGKDFAWREGVLDDAAKCGYHVDCWSPVCAKIQWLERYKELT